MSQNDMTIANQGFPATRADINSALQALASTSSGATEPSTMFANQLWFDTTANKLKIRNEANSAWYDIVGINESTGALTLNSATIGATTAAAGTFTTVTTSGNATIGGTAAMSSSFLRNRIINGDMRVDQRNAGTEVNPAVNQTYYLDRWVAISSAASKYKIGQNAGAVTPPTGYPNYLGLTSLSAYTVGSGEVFAVRQRLEGLNVSDLAWGTASAATVTLSFYVRSSLTGTFGGAFTNNASDRSYPFTYTISVANTWEQKTVTIAGDTSGTWLTTNGIGINVTFSIGASSTVSTTAGAWAAGSYASATGATSVVGTSGATFYVTGVQLEVGTIATPFERQLYNAQLAQCQRYYEGVGAYVSTTAWTAIINGVPPKVSKRAAPTVTTVVQSGSGAAFTWQQTANDTGNGTAYQTTGNSSLSAATVIFSAEL